MSAELPIGHDSFSRGDDETLIRDAASTWLRGRVRPSLARRLRHHPGMAEGYDRALWGELVDLGWAGVAVPTKFGGGGLGPRAVVALIEELGRTLAPVPLFSSALVGASVLTNFADTSLAARLLPGIVAGDIFALAHSPAQPLRIDHADQQSRISGAVTYVADGSISTWLLIGISDDEPGSLAVVRTDSPGVEITPITTIDGRAMADIVFQDSPIEAVLNGLANGNPLDWALDCARTGLAAEMLGAASEAFDITLDYLRTREQFGRAIGSFQAIQHRCALLSIELELTRSCVTKAADAIENDTTDRRRLVSLAKATAGELIRRMSYEMIQLHGGIGMTDEHDAGLYLKRGRVAGLLHGDASFHRDRYARLSGF